MAQNEIQTLDLYGTPTGGTCTLEYDGQVTSGIAYDATASAVNTALEALPNIGVGDVTCTGGPLPGSTVTIEFTGNLAETNVPQLVCDPSSLTGISITASFSETTPGVMAVGSGLNSYWSCEGSTHSSTMSDSHGVVILTKITGTGAVSTSGVISNARRWSSGKYTYRSAASTTVADALFDFSSGMTISFWVQHSSVPTSGFDVVIGYGFLNGSANGYAYRLRMEGTGYFKFDMTDNNGTNTSNTQVNGLSASTWNHIVCVYNATEKKKYLYLNGAEVDSDTISGPCTTATATGLFAVGPNSPSATIDIDEVAHWGRALDADEVSFLYNSGSGRNYTVTSSTSDTDEVQTLTVSGSPTAGYMTIGYDASFTNIDYDSTSAECETAAEGLASIGSGNISCGGGDLPGTPVTFTFEADLGGTDVDLMSVDYYPLWYKIETTQVGAPTPDQASAAWSTGPYAYSAIQDPATAAWSSDDVTAAGNAEQSTVSWSTSSLQAPGIPSSSLPTATWSVPALPVGANGPATVAWSTGTPTIPGVFSDSARAKWKAVQFGALPGNAVIANWRAYTPTVSSHPLNVPTSTWSSGTAIAGPALDGVPTATWSTLEATTDLNPISLPSAIWSAGTLSPVLEQPTATWSATQQQVTLISAASCAAWAAFRLIDEDLEVLTLNNEAVTTPSLASGSVSVPSFASETVTTPGVVSESLTGS